MRALRQAATYPDGSLAQDAAEVLAAAHLLRSEHLPPGEREADARAAMAIYAALMGVVPSRVPGAVRRQIVRSDPVRYVTVADGFRRRAISGGDLGDIGAAADLFETLIAVFPRFSDWAPDSCGSSSR